jgi:hypothetical protein
MSFVALCTGALVIIQTDNHNLTFIVARDSRSRHVNDLAIELHEFCTTHDLALEVQWVPRDLNQTADDINKIQDIDDMILNPAHLKFKIVYNNTGINWLLSMGPPCFATHVLFSKV